MVMRAAAAEPMPIPTFAPVPSPVFCDWGLFVGVAEDVAIVPGGREVDVGSKPLVYLTEPPALVGTIFPSSWLADRSCNYTVYFKGTTSWTNEDYADAPDKYFLEMGICSQETTGKTELD